MVLLDPKCLLRLGSGGSRRRSSNAKKARSYPALIELHAGPMGVDVESDDFRYHRLDSFEELEFWKNKALTLEDTLEEVEAKVAALELKSSHDMCVCADRSSSPTSIGSAVTSATEATTPPSTPERKHSKGAGQRRKDAIVKELVSEMERLMQLQMHAGDTDEHPTKNESNDEHPTTNESSDGSCDGCKDWKPNSSITSFQSSSTSCDNLSARSLTKVQTSALEQLVLRALDEASGAAKAQEMYQLSCRNCIGQNYVGATKKGELKDRAKEHYAVVWQVVQTAYGAGDDMVESAESPNERDLPFRASSFAHHVAEHCKDCKSEGEAYEWCVQNIKVERISKHLM